MIFSPAGDTDTDIDTHIHADVHTPQKLPIFRGLIFCKDQKSRYGESYNVVSHSLG